MGAPLNISDNSFTVSSLPSSENAASTSITPSPNSFFMTVFAKGSMPWSGPNMGGGKFGNEDIGGGPGTIFGGDEFGGVSKTKSNAS